MSEARRLLARVFGFPDFRPGQDEIVAAVEAGRDVLAIMPTGGGKSLCYQLPALTRDGVTLVVSPLIALMRDQVRALRAAGVEAGALTSQSDREETEAVFAALDDGRLKLLYMAPERLAAAGDRRRCCAGSASALLAVDEAHCVSQWGHDFRPDYLRIGELRRALGGVQTVALTATADAETRAEIVARLFDGQPPETFLRGFDRPNLAPRVPPQGQPAPADPRLRRRPAAASPASSTAPAAPRPRRWPPRSATPATPRSPTTPGSTPTTAASPRPASSARTG